MTTLEQVDAKVASVATQIYPKIFKATNKKVKKLIDKLITPLSSIRRIYQNIQDLKYTYQLPRKGLICTIFKITRFESKIQDYDNNYELNLSSHIGGDDTSPTSCIYGYLYSVIEDSSIAHKYICTGGTYTSQDGEYRRRFIPFYKLDVIKEQFPKQWDFVENLIISKMDAGTIQLNADFFFPQAIYDETRNTFIEKVNCDRLAIHLYMLCWMIDYDRIHRKMIENHINPAYQYIIYDPDDLPAYNEYLSLCENRETLLQISYHAEILQKTMPRIIPELYTDKYPRNNISVRVKTGQKLFSMTAHEVDNHLDIDSNIWREFYIAAKTTDVVINLISPSFAVLNDWFIIEGAHPGIFDNPSQYMRFIQGKTADEIANELTSIDKLAYESSIELNTQRPKSARFQDLSDIIHDGINYARSNITLTDKILCFHVEHVGFTVRDVPAFAAHPNIEYRQINTSFRNFEFFKGYLFEYLYGLYTLNTVVGAMHGDLHINNVTLYEPMRYMKIENTKYKLYIINEDKQPEVYAFAHTGIFGIIIDFSRSIIGNLTILKKDFGAEYTKSFIEKQAPRVEKIVLANFPQLYKKHEKVFKLRVEHDIESVFKVISIIDVITLTQGMLSMFMLEQQPEFSLAHGKFELADGIKSLVSVSAARATEIFLEYFEILIADNTGKKIASKEWPILTLIRELFKYDMFDLMTQLPDKILNHIGDIFIYNSELFYSLMNYDRYPQIMKPDEYMIELYEKYGIKDKEDEYKQIVNWLRGVGNIA